MRIGNVIYLDHQATTPLDSRILGEMAPYFVSNMGNPHSSDHIIGWNAARAVDSAAKQVANLIGADNEEIIFTSGASESNNLALLGLARRATGGKRRRILIGAIEHKCILAASRIIAEQLGYQVEVLPVDSNGLIDVGALEETLDEDVLLVSIMAVNNEIGTIQDIPALSKTIRRFGALFHCDAAQAPCAIDLNSIADHVDLLSLSAHKMYGPMGIGALFVPHNLQGLIEPLIYGGGQQHNLRSGTVPLPLSVGMGKAATLIGSAEAAKEKEAVRRRCKKFLEQLMALPWPLKMNGPPQEVRHPGNVNIRFCGFSAHDILHMLQPHVAASTGSACTSGMTEPSHVLKAIGLSTEEAESSIRFSLGRNTTDDDLDKAVGFIHETLSKLAQSNLIKSA